MSVKKYPKGKLILEESNMTVTLTLNEISVEQANEVLGLFGTADEETSPEASPLPSEKQNGTPLFEEIEPENSYTVEDVRKAFAAYGKSKGKDAAKALLTKYGAAKVTELSAEHYAAVMKELG